MTKKELWLNIKNYNFENLVHPSLWEEIKSKFTSNNAFTEAFANKVKRKHNFKNLSLVHFSIQEYKKFIYLGVVSDYQVTPPKIIDIIWHEHLLFTKGYRDFCKEIIKYDFDHHPELVPIGEQTAIYDSQYKYTLDLYFFEFGVVAPSVIWSETKYISSKNNSSSLKQKKQFQNSSNSFNNYSLNYSLASLFTDEMANNSSGFNEFGGGNGGGAGASGDWSDSESDSDGDDSGGCSSGCGGGGD
jgi:hypothetical protein